MKTYFLIVLLAASAFAQSELDATAMEQEMNDSYNAAKKQEAQDEYDAQMRAFQDSINKAIVDHQAATKIVNVGEFEIIVQENCTIEFPSQPEKPTVVEKECFKAKHNAETTAGLIAKATPLNPPNIEMVASAMNNCELQVSIVKSFEIYNTCWEDELPAEYRSIYQAQVDALEAKGYAYNEETKKWEKSYETQKINLASDPNNVVPASEANAPQ